MIHYVYFVICVLDLWVFALRFGHLIKNLIRFNKSLNAKCKMQNAKKKKTLKKKVV